LQRILIDENLSPSLVPMAHERGFECSHINHLGLTGLKDWELKTTIIDGDWTFVTNNGVDFRGPADRPGSSGEYADVTVHAGLVCITAPGGLSLAIQRQLFDLILNDIERNGDLTNQVLEVVLNRNGELQIARREMPES
jgi:hypothetical protein